MSKRDELKQAVMDDLVTTMGGVLVMNLHEKTGNERKAEMLLQEWALDDKINDMKSYNAMNKEAEKIADRILKLMDDLTEEICSK